MVIEVNSQEKRSLIARETGLLVVISDEHDQDGNSADTGGCVPYRRTFLMSGAALSACVVMAAAILLLSRRLVMQQEADLSMPSVQSKQLEHFSADMSCMPQCPASRRLEEEHADGVSSLEKCLESCPSTGFMATMEFGECKAKCQRKHPAAGMKNVPDSEPPLEGCKRQCRQHGGNFWHLLYSDCAQACAAKTALPQVQYMKKYNISFDSDMEDLHADVTALLRTRFQFKKRSSSHPFSFVLEKYQKKVADALGKVLELPEDAPLPHVILRQYRPGIHHVVPRVLFKDPGDDVEAVVDMKGLPISDVKKLSDKSVLKKIDEELRNSLVRDLTTVGLAEVSPTEALESTSSTVDGNFVSLGWHTVCRLNEADTSYDGNGKARIVHGQSLQQCSMLCNDWNIFCYGFEFRSHTGRCEIWTTPICAHTQVLKNKDLGAHEST
ncbi:LIP [Symbiodinium natans]|uniref:LIP protein n=1 Tax=Symbiodinium natans TaxID=878477 RepID=A0A812PG22_9DINO|nr:LIP [Symbiodinium natans]